MRFYLRIQLSLLLSALLLSCAGGNDKQTKVNSKDSGYQVEVAPRSGGKKINTDNTIIQPLSLAECNIKGKVKFISFRKYSLGRWNRKVLTAKGYYSYDTSGYLLCHNEYKSDGIQTIGCIYNYDKNHRATEWNIMDQGNGRDSKIVFKYGKKGNKTEEIIDDKDPKFSIKATFKYDSAGDEIQEKDYADDGKLKEIISFRYDNKGNQTEVSHLAALTHVVQSKFTCTYDDNSNEIAGKKYSSDTAVVVKWSCKNNDKGKCTEKVYYTTEGYMTMKNTFKYDTIGNLTEYNYFRADGSFNEDDSYSLEYMYDKTRNVIKQTKVIKRSGKQVLVEYTEYDIVYY